VKLSNEFKVGVLAIVGIALLVFGYNFLKGTNIVTKGNFYTIEYSYIPGLKKGDPIQINGYEIGRVSDIVLRDPKKGTIEVLVNVTEDVAIPIDSKATIKSADLLGEKYIDLRLGSSEQVFQNGDHFIGDIEADLTNQIKEELKPLTEKVQSMIVSVDTAITVLSSIFTPSFKDNFETSVRNIKLTLENFNNSARMLDEMLAKQQPEIEGIIGDVASITGNVKKNEASLNEIILNLESLTDSLSTIDWKGITSDIDQAVVSLNSILSTVEAGEGTLGKLVNDEELYNSLTEIAKSLEIISNEIQVTPGKYVPPLIQIGGKKYKE
jgi:phospholipid/cholesterol/gamma-HCH transport system substrate-binding protein